MKLTGQACPAPVDGGAPRAADRFLCEVQEIRPSVAPYVDERMAEGARRAGLPENRAEPGHLPAETGHPARLAAVAHVRNSLTRNPSPT